jgi:hypothetical protein
MDQSSTKSSAGPSPWQAPPDYVAHSLVASFLSSELRWGAHVALLRLVSRDWRTTVDSVLPVLAPRTGVPLAKLATLCRRCTGLRVLRVQEPGGLLLILITHRMWPLNSVGLEFCAAVRSLGGATLLGCAQRMCLPSSQRCSSKACRPCHSSTNAIISCCNRRMLLRRPRPGSCVQSPG